MTDAAKSDRPADETPTTAPPATTASTSEPEPEPEPTPPEPWTAAKVVEWNNYYDLFVAVFVLVLAFFASANKIANPSVWAHLRAGRDIAHGASPTANLISYTQPDDRWVHVAWLSDLGHFGLYHLVAGLAPVDPIVDSETATPEVIEARRDRDAAADQWGSAGLIAVDALIRTLTVLLLLAIRHRGPGLWWAATVAMLAMAALPIPPEILVLIKNGGISGPLSVGPAVWAGFLLAAELLLVFMSFDRGKRWPLLALPPLFLLWANVDETFLLGLLILAASVVGLVVNRPGPAEGTRPSPRDGLVTLGVSALICLVNPSIFRVYPAALGTLVPISGWYTGPPLVVDTSYFGPAIASQPAEYVRFVRFVFGSLVAIGALSFALNLRRFSLGRFLVFAIAAALWGLAQRFAAEFAVVLVATLGLNGQEWYQSTIGTEGRLGRGWSVFSIGGRAITLVFVAWCVARVLTGNAVAPGEGGYGWTYDADTIAFEAAEFVRDAPIGGNVLNWTLNQGDSIAWRAASTRKTYLDSRRHLFTKATMDRFEAARKAIRDGDKATWAPILDELKVSAVMLDIDPGSASIAARTYQTVTSSRDWISIYDDGATAIFGRADAGGPDLGYFKAHRRDADAMTYKNPTPLPSTTTLPRPTSDLDRFFRLRTARRAQSHTRVAGRWLRPSDLDPNAAFFPDPARCHQAIREARLALAARAEDHTAWAQLASAYKTLLLDESALMAGLEPTPENYTALRTVPIQTGLLSSRFRQYTTALAFALATAPPVELLPVEGREQLRELNVQMASALSTQGIVDLTRDRLRAVIDLTDPSTVSPEYFASLSKQIEDLNNRMIEIEGRIAAMGMEGQGAPLQKAVEARRYGAVGLAIQYLDEAFQGGLNRSLIVPSLLDLYCQVGQPEKALTLWEGDNTAILNDGAGTAPLRQGKVFLLLGNYASAVTAWARDAIPSLTAQRALKAPQATRALLEGDPMGTEQTFLGLPEEVTKEALWEFELGLACLEAGYPPEEAAKHLTIALKVTPDLTVRPVIAYYLKKLGKPVPEDTRTPGADPARPTAPALPLPSVLVPGQAPIP